MSKNDRYGLRMTESEVVRNDHKSSNTKNSAALRWNQANTLVKHPRNRTSTLEALDEDFADVDAGLLLLDDIKF